MEQLQGERDRQRRLRELAEQSCAAGAADQQAALKQAERLAALCEEQEQQCRQLQAQVSDLQGRLGSQSALQKELVQVGLLPGDSLVCLLALRCGTDMGPQACATGGRPLPPSMLAILHQLSLLLLLFRLLLQLAERNRQLEIDSLSQQGQLERFCSAVQQAEGDSIALQQAADTLQVEQLRLQARGQQAEAEARKLARLAEELQAANAALEQQLAAAHAEASQAGAERQQLAAAAAELRGERDELAATSQQLLAEKEGLEAAVGRLRGQLQQSNGVLDACRQMLGDCSSAR
jgi:hypothetical protein